MRRIKKIIKLTKRNWKAMKTRGWTAIELTKYPHSEPLFSFNFGNDKDLFALLTWTKKPELLLYKYINSEGEVFYSSDPRIKNATPEYIFHLK